MCTLAVFRSVSPLYPLVVVANRDEFLGRASSLPSQRSGNIVCGLDLVAGGTWLGCRTDGSARIVGLLNRRAGLDRAAAGRGDRSRGLLCMDALVGRAMGDASALPSMGETQALRTIADLSAPWSIEAALAGLDAKEASRYGGFNLFVADLKQAVVVDNGAGVRQVTLVDGLSVVTNLDVNDARCSRLTTATQRFDALSPLLRSGADVDELVPALAAVLSSHTAGSDVVDDVAQARFGHETTGRFAKVCVHIEDYGTRSSTMIFVAPSGKIRYFHADAAPCVAEFRELVLQRA